MRRILRILWVATLPDNLELSDEPLHALPTAAWTPMQVSNDVKGAKLWEKSVALVGLE